LSFDPSGARLLLSLQFAQCQELGISRSIFAVTEAIRTASAAVNNLAEKTSFSSTGTEGAFYEGNFGHINGGSSRYVVFDYVAYGGAKLGT
jgi:hypothetical protein